MKFALRVIAMYLIIGSCARPELSDIKPVIQFKTIEGYQYKDASFSPGVQYTVGIHATSGNGENLTNLIVESNGNRIFDKGYNQPEINEDILIVKNLDKIEILDFIIRNKSRKSDTTSLLISLLQASNSPILRYNQIIIGAQANSQTGNYFSYKNGQVYAQSEAFNNQLLIDVVYYYDPTGDANTFASPGANLSGIISGTDSPEFWNIRRTTRYSRLPLLIDDEKFNKANNDSLIVANIFTDGGRKAKQLIKNQYYGILTNENKYGLLRVESVEGEYNGTIKISTIIQK